MATVASGLFIPHISGETDFSLERDSKRKIADFRKMSFTAGLLTDLSSLRLRVRLTFFPPLDGSKSLTQRRKDAEISE